MDERARPKRRNLPHRGITFRSLGRVPESVYLPLEEEASKAGVSVSAFMAGKLARDYGDEAVIALFEETAQRAQQGAA